MTPPCRRSTGGSLLDRLIQRASEPLVQRATGGHVRVEHRTSAPCHLDRVLARNHDHTVSISHNHVAGAHERSADRLPATNRCTS